MKVGYTHPFNGPFPRTTQVSRYQKGKTNVDFTEARDSAWQWHHPGHMQRCAPRSRQTTMPAPYRSVFTGSGFPSCRPTNSVKALKANKVGMQVGYSTDIMVQYYWQGIK